MRFVEQDPTSMGHGSMEFRRFGARGMDGFFFLLFFFSLLPNLWIVAEFIMLMMMCSNLVVVCCLDWSFRTSVWSLT